MSEEQRSARPAPEGDPRRDLDPLEPALSGNAGGWRRIRRRWRLLARAAGLAAVLGVMFLVRDQPLEDVTCSASREANTAVMVRVCTVEYQRTRDPAIGLILAWALVRSVDYPDATAVAKQLLTTPLQADALDVLGWIAVYDEHFDDAVSLFTRAREMHRAADDRAKMALDDQGLASALSESKRYAEALRALDRCIADAQSAGGGVTEAYCHLSAARTLSLVGFRTAAQLELARAGPMLHADRDVAELYLQEGNLDQEVGHNQMAIVAFERAFAIIERAQLGGLAPLSAYLNRAYSLAETRRLDEAERALEKARALDPKNAGLPWRLAIAGRIAQQRGQLVLAASLLDQADRLMTDGDDHLEIAILQARIALQGHDLAAAERWARRGIARAEEIRSAQGAIELRPWVLSSRRAPYEILFATLVRSGRVEDALVAFDEWHGRALLDALARPETSGEPFALGAAAVRTEELRALVPSLSEAPIMKGADRRAILERVHSGDLLLLAVADGELWRVVAHRGAIRADSLGPIEALRPSLEDFQARPTSPALAEKVGALLVPETLFRDDPRPLRVLLDGPIAALPIAGLRRHGRPLVAARPLVRIPRLSAACTPATTAARPATVLADAGGDLTHARREAERVAGLLGAARRVGHDATSAALFAADRGGILHVATHGVTGEVGGELRLRDRAVSALEISARRGSPALVVLFVCGSAVARDLEQATSLAMAFLAAGASQVVGTVRDISDAGAEEVSRRFYQRLVAVPDPVRALAAVQAELAALPGDDWPSFAVFGTETCPATQ
jgi:tetratricopeptide (TPR) repeat protein